MNLILTTHGEVLLGAYFSRLRPRFADFEIKRDGETTWVITCPGKNIKYPVAMFVGTYIEASKALKLKLVTARMLQ